jgi:hypothetical protein
MRLVSALLALVTLLAASVPAPAQNSSVDLELVLAVDVSGSVDYFEARLQRQGYIDALTDPRFLQAVRNGRHGRIAITYLEWGGWGLFRHVVDWRVISDEASARAFVGELGRIEPSFRGTSISGAIGLSLQLFALNAHRAERKVIDISGDGPNNEGASVVYFRDLAVSRGITINGLPILAQQGAGNVVADLDVYYEECVIGGPGAFVIAAQTFETFAEAVLRKLILEIAEEAPAPPTVTKAQFLQPGRPGGAVGPQPKAPKYFPYCDIPNTGRRTIFPVPNEF